MLSKLHTQYIAFFAILAILLNWILFGDLSVDFIFILGNIIAVFIILVLFNFCQKNFINLPEKAFKRNIFWFSLALRIFSVLFYYCLFYYITDTEFDVEAIDAVVYHDFANDVLKDFRTGNLTPASFLISVGGDFDDAGYVVFLAFIYSIFEDGILIARIVQAVIGAFTVLLIYKTTKEFFDERTGKLAAIILATFQPILLYTAVHMKEVIMVHFVFLFLYYSVQLLKKNKSITISITIVFVSFLGMLSVRTVLAIIALTSLIIYLLLSGNRIFTLKKITVLLSIAAIVFILASSITILSETVNKSKAYFGLKSENQTTVGGMSKEAYVEGGQNFAKYAGGGVFLFQSLITPYPSMVKTNIVFFNQTLQWYFAGALLIWVMMVYYAYVGIYYAIKQNFKKTSLLVFITAIYTLSLVASFYITSIRYNIVKMALLIPFIAYGIVLANNRVKRNFIKYVIVVTIMVLLWNYIKIAGRGLA